MSVLDDEGEISPSDMLEILEDEDRDPDETKAYANYIFSKYLEAKAELEEREAVVEAFNQVLEQEGVIQGQNIENSKKIDQIYDKLEEMEDRLPEDGDYSLEEFYESQIEFYDRLHDRLDRTESKKRQEIANGKDLY